MPYRKRYRKKRYRKRKRFRKKRRPAMSKISYLKLRRPTGFPDQMYVKLRYHDIWSPSTLSPASNKTYALNGLYDPDVTGIGKQPMGFDEYMNFYSSYQVLASSIKCQLLDDTGSQIRTLVIWPSNTAALITNLDQAREQTYAKHRYITNAASSQVAFMKHYITVKKLEARDTSSVNFIGNIGGNPTSVRYWQLLLHTLGGGAITEMYVDVQIQFYCKFFRRNQLNVS